MMTRPSHYQILGVNQQDSVDTIKSAYKSLVRIWHPDRSSWMGCLNEEQKKYAHEVISRINEAHRVLTDPKEKAEYDMQLRWMREDPVDKQRNDAFIQHWEELKQIYEVRSNPQSAIKKWAEEKAILQGIIAKLEKEKKDLMAKVDKHEPKEKPAVDGSTGYQQSSSFFTNTSTSKLHIAGLKKIKLAANKKNNQWQNFSVLWLLFNNQSDFNYFKNELGKRGISITTFKEEKTYDGYIISIISVTSCSPSFSAEDRGQILLEELKKYIDLTEVPLYYFDSKSKTEERAFFQDESPASQSKKM